MSKINDEGSDIVVFSYSGKIIIGRLFGEETGARSSFITNGTVINDMGIKQSDLDDFYAVANPCEIVFEITKPNTGSAQLNWTLKPFFFKKLMKDTTSEMNFIFPKSEVCLSNLSSGCIDDNILQAYKELIQII